MQPGPVIDPDLIIPHAPPSDPEPYVPQLPVCIIGAGVSGLYIAMMLDSLGIKYELMEGSGRTGGRLYTHRFPKNAGKYQYFVINIF
jgi:monoamine oxidase